MWYWFHLRRAIAPGRVATFPTPPTLCCPPSCLLAPPDHYYGRDIRSSFVFPRNISMFNRIRLGGQICPCHHVFAYTRDLTPKKAQFSKELKKLVQFVQLSYFLRVLYGTVFRQCGGVSQSVSDKVTYWAVRGQLKKQWVLNWFLLQSQWMHCTL